MLKVYGSVTDGFVSRWSFYTACIDPTAPLDAPCRKNVVVRSSVLFWGVRGSWRGRVGPAGASARLGSSFG